VKNPRSFAASFLFFLLIAGLGLWFGIRSRTGWRDAQPAPAVSAPEQKPSAQRANEAAVDQSPEAMIARLFRRLRSGPLAAGELDAFRASLLGGDPRKTIAAIVQFLGTGQDALTGERFSIGKNGELAGAPTFRVLMLDLLGRVCREAGAPDAGVVSRALLQKKTSADEWAVALRNVGWATPGDRAYLAEKTRELVSHQPWQQQPTAGYYEAFDLIVFTADVSSIPQLAELVRGKDEPLKNTAATTLDRLAAMAPLDVMSYLNTHPAELADKQFLRADYYAKADFTQAAQRAAVEAYLDRPDVEPRAKGKLIATLGNPGVFVSENLLTSTPQAAADDVPPLQKAALQRAVGEWLKSNRYPSLTGALLAKQEGLAE
jgi:hypothetical protein